MNRPLTEKISELKPSDDKFYFSFSSEDLSSSFDKLAILNGFEGMVLLAPDRIDIKDDTTIPLLWMFRSTAYRQWQVERTRNSFVIFSDLHNSSISIGNAYTGKKRLNYAQIEKSSEGNPPNEDMAEGTIADVRMLDCRVIMRYPQLQPTTLAITLIQFDWVSNTVKVELNDPSLEKQTVPGISESASMEICKKMADAVKNPKDASVFSPSQKAPVITRNGIVAEIPSRVSAKDYKWMVHGALKINVPAGAIVNRSNDDKSSSGIPTAIVTALLIINKLDCMEPDWITLKLPVFTQCNAGSEVSTSFSVDLKKFGSSFSEHGLYQIFIACGEYVSGPYPIKVTF